MTCQVYWTAHLSSTRGPTSSTSTPSSLHSCKGPPWNAKQRRELRRVRRAARCQCEGSSAVVARETPHSCDHSQQWSLTRPHRRDMHAFSPWRHRTALTWLSFHPATQPPLAVHRTHGDAHAVLEAGSSGYLSALGHDRCPIWPHGRTCRVKSGVRTPTSRWCCAHLRTTLCPCVSRRVRSVVWVVCLCGCRAFNPAPWATGGWALAYLAYSRQPTPRAGGR